MASRGVNKVIIIGRLGMIQKSDIHLQERHLQTLQLLRQNNGVISKLESKRSRRVAPW